MKNLVEAMHSLKENKEILTDAQKAEVREEIETMVYQMKQDGYTNEDLEMILEEPPFSEEGILQNDALYEIEDIDMDDDEVEEEVAKVALAELKRILEKVDEGKELNEKINDTDFIVYRQTSTEPLYLSDTTNTTFDKEKAIRFPTEEEAEEARHEYIQSVSDPEADQFKVARLNENKLNEDEEKPLANESDTFKNISDSLINYDAFTANFGPVVKVLKFQNDYLIYRSEAKNYDEYIYKADNKDEIEGWLYGCVQVANGILKPVQK